MRQDFESVKSITLGQKKEYLFHLCRHQQFQDRILDCMNDRDLNHFMKQASIQLYVNACEELYNSKNYDQLEYHLVMMNSFFHYQSYQDIKKDLLTKLLSKPITINEYCIIRHLVIFDKQSFSQLISKLHDEYHVNSEECAKICLLEECYTLACYYLKQLDECHNDQLLDLLCSYSVSEYLSLLRYYKRKKKDYQLIMSH